MGSVSGRREEGGGKDVRPEPLQASSNLFKPLQARPSQAEPSQNEKRETESPEGRVTGVLPDVCLITERVYSYSYLAEM